MSNGKPGLFHHNAKQRSVSGKSGAANLHGDSVVYLDGRPVLLTAVSKETGVPMSTLRDRIYRTRKAGKKVTRELLYLPLQEQYISNRGDRPKQASVTITVNRSRWKA